MSNTNDQEAVTFLREFFEEMTQWQLDCSKRNQALRNDKTLWEEPNRLNERGYERFQKNEAVGLAELRHIFDKYCQCTKEFPVGTAGCDPPWFDKNSLVVDVAKKGAKTIVVIERTIDSRRLQYTLLSTEQGLRVSDQVKILDPIKNKFVSHDILL